MSQKKLTSLASAAVLLACGGAFGAFGAAEHPAIRAVRKAPPGPKETRTPECIADRLRKRDEKLARRARRHRAEKGSA